MHDLTREMCDAACGSAASALVEVWSLLAQADLAGEEGTRLLEIGNDVYLTTYSTLASTLAGAFGFLVAVVLYVMQGINMHISNCASSLVAGSPADRHRLQQLQSSGQWDEIVRLHAHAGQQNPALNPDDNRRMDEQFQEMRRALARLVVLRGELSQSMYLTGFVILASIISMPLTAFFLTPQSPVAATILTLTIISAMFCLRGYFRLMLTVVQP